MQTIPDDVLDRILVDRPDFADDVAQLRAKPHLAQGIERSIAWAYLEGSVLSLTPLQAWHLAQVAHGGPWGGDWVTTSRAATLSGYSDAHIRRMAGSGQLPVIKRGKTWYVKRDALPHRDT
jgi:hypothetical protein